MIDGVKQELEKAKRDTASALAFYRFCRDNPRYSVQANEGFLRAYCDENGLTYTKEHFEEAAKMVSHLLAQKESVKPPTPAPEPVKSPEEQHAEEVKRLRSLSPDELRKLIRGAAPKQPALHPSTGLTVDELKALTPDQIRATIHAAHVRNSRV